MPPPRKDWGTALRVFIDELVVDERLQTINTTAGRQSCASFDSWHDTSTEFHALRHGDSELDTYTRSAISPLRPNTQILVARSRRDRRSAFRKPSEPEPAATARRATQLRRVDPASDATKCALGSHFRQTFVPSGSRGQSNSTARETPMSTTRATNTVGADRRSFASSPSLLTVPATPPVTDPHDIDTGAQKIPGLTCCLNSLTTNQDRHDGRTLEQQSDPLPLTGESRPPCARQPVARCLNRILRGKDLACGNRPLVLRLKARNRIQERMSTRH